MSNLDKLDNYYNSRSSSEAWLMVAIAAGAVALLLHTLIYPTAESYRKSEEKRNKTLKSNIKKAENYLRSKTVNGDQYYYVKQKEKIIAQKNMELNNLRMKLTKVRGAVTKLSAVVYNKDNWSKFLDNIAKQAKDNNLKVFNIANKAYDNNGTFGKVLDVEVKTQGSYGNILSFMNDLETNDMVTNVTTAVIKPAPNNPIADINFSVWGIRP